MADLTINAANVGIKGNTGQVRIVQVGEVVTKGQIARFDGTKYYRTQADSASNATIAGVFLSSASTDGYAVLLSGAAKLNPGATVTVGTVYVVSATAGGIAPESDLASGDFVAILGVGSASDEITMNINNSGQAKP
ncbi:MAG: hypothetical protein AAFU85_02140 [Planctomycetota bacterium]